MIGRSAPALRRAPAPAFGLWKFAHFVSAWGYCPARTTLQPSPLPRLGKASPESGPAGPRAHLTRPAFSPEMAAFRYCFHAVTLSFMSPMNALPSAVLQGVGGALRGSALPPPLRSYMLEVLLAQTLRRPCAAEHSQEASPATSHCPQSCPGTPRQGGQPQPQNPTRDLGAGLCSSGPVLKGYCWRPHSVLQDRSPDRPKWLPHPL